MSRIDLDALSKYDTPTVCNVVELFDLYPRTAGYMDGRIVACHPKLPPMVGYASTAPFRSAAPPRGGNGYARLAGQGPQGRAAARRERLRRPRRAGRLVRQTARPGGGRLPGPRLAGRRRHLR